MVRRELGTHVLGDGGGPVETQQQARLQLRLGTLDLDRSGRERHAGPFSEGKVGQVIDDRKAKHGACANQYARVSPRSFPGGWASTAIAGTDFSVVM